VVGELNKPCDHQRQESDHLDDGGKILKHAGLTDANIVEHPNKDDDTERHAGVRHPV